MRMKNDETIGVKHIIDIGLVNTIKNDLTKSPMTTGKIVVDNKEYTYNAMIDNAYREDALLILTRTENNKHIDMAMRIPLI